MAKEEILAMEVETADPSIIATEVMGWRKGDHSVGEYGWYEGKSYKMDSFWNPWEDIWTAWQVVEKLEEQELLLFINVTTVCLPQGWGAEFAIVVGFCKCWVGTSLGEVSRIYCKSIKEIPEAISKAALLSKLDKLKEV